MRPEGTLLRTSTLFVPTLRDDPADAEAPSHRLLQRAGYVRRVAPGLFTWLPLGLRVLRRVETVVRQEMELIGAQEVQFPALLPREPYETTGRWSEYGDTLFRLRDRRGADFLLGPTHEEMFTLLVQGDTSSYRDLPLILFQIQSKYRDEARPRAGLLRGREFVMKDSYSFDGDSAGSERSYQKHRAAYCRILDRLGVEYVIVSAVAGAMGGSASEEFLAPADAGEDVFARCSTCSYAANVEAVTVRAPAAATSAGGDAARIIETPGTPTIGSLVEFLNSEDALRRLDRPWIAADTLKNILLIAVAADGDESAIAIGIPGDREVDQRRVEAHLGAVTVRVFGADDFERYPGLVPGYIGPAALAENSIRYLVDPRVAHGTAWVTGADRAGAHVVDFAAGRDFHPDGSILGAEVRDGDECPQCDGVLRLARGIEVGHVFQLGAKYSDALSLRVLGSDGKPTAVMMGSYGIGISRLVATVAEQHYDERGLTWPGAVSPADVHIVATGRDDAPFAAAGALAKELVAHGLSVLFDDRRAVSPGVKFADAELIGIPRVVVIGKRLVDGLGEVWDRASGDRSIVPVDKVAERLLQT